MQFAIAIPSNAPSPVEMLLRDLSRTSSSRASSRAIIAIRLCAALDAWFISTTDAITIALHVARVAGRLKIDQPIIALHAIQVIDAQPAIAAPIPAHHTAADITLSGGVCDLLIQHEAVLVGPPCLVRKRVARGIDLNIAARIHPPGLAQRVRSRAGAPQPVVMDLAESGGSRPRRPVAFRDRARRDRRARIIWSSALPDPLIMHPAKPALRRHPSALFNAAIFFQDRHPPVPSS